MDAIYPYARDHLHFPDQITKDIQPFKVKKLLFWGSDNPNVIVNVSNFEKRKIDALLKELQEKTGVSDEEMDEFKKIMELADFSQDEK